jgi:hypothetical protein
MPDGRVDHRYVDPTTGMLKFKLFWKDGSSEVIEGFTFGDALRVSGIATVQETQDIDYFRLASVGDDIATELKKQGYKILQVEISTSIKEVKAHVIKFLTDMASNGKVNQYYCNQIKEMDNFTFIRMMNAVQGLEK